MSRKDTDRPTKSKNFDIDKSRQRSLSGRHKDRLPAAQETDISRRERAIVDDEAAVLSREKSAGVREDAMHVREKSANLREDAVYIREGAIQAREGEVHTRERAATAREHVLRAADTKRAASDDRSSIMQQANSQLMVSVIEAHKLAEQVETAQVQMRHLAHHDALTGLPNRMLLQDRLRQALVLARRQGTQLAVLFMDLDRFKNINDSLGHTIGDRLLQSAAQRLVDCVRHSDTVSRQGGDEFVALLSNIKHAEDAALIAQNMLTTLAVPHRIDHHELHVPASIGISIYPSDGQDAESLLMHADSAMYHAKENGRNSYKFFEHEMNARAIERLAIENGLRRALEQREFVLFYQPKIDLHSHTIIGVETLIRWQHPEKGLVPPARFVPIAENCGLILPIGRWVLREACLQARSWRQAGLPPITVAINTSALEFRAKDFLENIRATLTDTCLEPHYLELELTEGVLMQDAELTKSVLHALADLGVKLAIDDFGTGYSSLSYLRQFPINTLKIDQSFVKGMIGDSDSAAIVSAVINMGKSLNLRVCAAGVEMPEQHTFLLTQHCDEGQGFYFGRPAAADALATLLQTGISSLPHH